MKYFKLLTAVAVSCLVLSCMEMVGAFSSERDITDDELALFDIAYSGDISLTPKTVATQVVSGTNYAFVCRDSEKKVYTVIIYEPLPGQGEPEVLSVTEGNLKKALKNR